MSLMVYFLRHGQTVYSRANDYCGSLDPELTDEGMEMAQAFAQAYKSFPWTAIFCSPLRRTIATAKPLCDAIGMEMQLRDGLKEITYGKWEGLSPEEVSLQFHDDYIRYLADPGWNAPTGGERAVDIAQRSSIVLEEIEQKYKTGNILVVSHKATIRIMLCWLLGIDVGRFRDRISAPVASVSVIEYGVHGPLLHVLGDRSHLSERLRNLPGT
ncbi:histidine phosphatase family protein [Phormidium sp. LEGE 05292]|uniref:histidine phosphatase family protein n=1 Tax=[Phormidium] sp. LEGE 05292 TaxID=767427 RepID=UPI0018809EFE|nr:histidine phosphatase family protein [Phormidium sp. LEGE 05292]MBE9229537.1 histidine phosphatase family protein [Phormidium sp. LEGE 05292]